MNNKKDITTVGIDLGTTNSAIGVIEDKKPFIISNRETGEKTTPSVVYVKSKNNIIVGQEALDQYVLEPHKVFKSIKSKMGENWSREIDGTKYNPELISSLILTKLLSFAKKYVGYDIKEGVVTVPAYFTEAQRQATKNAGLLAGLNVKRIINEPTAASLAYATANVTEKQNILVFDLGGGTFDVSVLNTTGDLTAHDGKGIVKILSTSGDNKLGGDDFDNCIKNLIISDLKRANQHAALNDLQIQSRISQAARMAKEKLSFNETYNIQIPFISANFNYKKVISRREFDHLTKALINKCKLGVDKALEGAKLLHSNINKILLVGGSTRIPRVKTLVGELFEPSKIVDSIDPDLVVAKGAALKAAPTSKTGKSIVLIDVNALTLGIDVEHGMMAPLIPHNTSIPVTKSQIFTNAFDGQEQCKIEIFQGQSRFNKNNVSLGNFFLSFGKAKRKGEAQIKVVMKLDTSSLLTVQACNIENNKEGKYEQIKINMSRKLSEKEIKDMFDKAKAIEDFENKKVKNINLLNSIYAETDQLSKILNNKDALKLPKDVIGKFKSFITQINSKLDAFKIDIDNLDETKLKQIQKEIKDKEQEFTEQLSKAVKESSSNTDNNKNNNSSSENMFAKMAQEKAKKEQEAKKFEDNNKTKEDNNNNKETKKNDK